MKKKIILIAMLIGICMDSNANEVRIVDRILNNDITKYVEIEPSIKNYDFVINHEQLGKFLGLSEKDSVKNENVYRVYDVFCESMSRAGIIKDEEIRTNLINNTIDYSLRNMRMYLNDRQYHMFLRMLNVSFINKGLHQEAYTYCLWVNNKK